MASMNLNQKIEYTLTLRDAAGVETKDYDAGSIVAVASPDGIVSVAPDADNELHGFVLAVAPGDAVVAWSGTSAGGANAFSASASFTVNAPPPPGPAMTLEVTLGEPIDQ